MSKIVPCLGHVSGYPRCIITVDQDVRNQHILFTGSSGSGKTVALRKTEQSIVQQGGVVLVLDFHGTHAKGDAEEKNVYRIPVKRMGYPLRLFSSIRYPNGKSEKADDIVESILNVFCGLEKMGSKQKRTLRQALHCALEICVNNMLENEFDALKQGLEMIDCQEAEDILDKLRYLLANVVTSKEVCCLHTGQITIFDFSDYNLATQKLLTQLSLELVWRYYQIWGQCANLPLYIVCDEFQVLDFHQGSILEQILREGRKYNLCLLMATQTLMTFKTDQRVVLQQAATQLYFRPSQAEIRKQARLIPDMRIEEAVKMLSQLQIGECLAVGRFVVGEKAIERPIKVSFR